MSKQLIVECWACSEPTSKDNAQCQSCNYLQPITSIDHFTRFNLPPSFDIDPATLEKAYFTAQHQFHPDRYAVKSSQEKAYAAAHSVATNEGYQILKDPVKRAAYILKLNNIEAWSDQNTVNDPEILMATMDVQEKMADPANHPSLKKELDQQHKAIMQDLSKAFQQNDLDQAKRLTIKLKYLTKQITDLKTHLPC